MPGHSYDQIRDLFLSGGRVLGRPWGRPYDDDHGCCCREVSLLMPDCSDFQIEAGHVPPRRTSTARERPRIIG